MQRQLFIKLPFFIAGNFYVPGNIFSWHRTLRRTLVLSVHYASFLNAAIKNNRTSVRRNVRCHEIQKPGQR